MFLVSARLSSSLPSYFPPLLFLLSFYLYFNTVQCSLLFRSYAHWKNSRNISLFFLLPFDLVFGFCCCRWSARAAIEPFYNRSGDLWYFSDGLFHIIDFSVILNYRKKDFFLLSPAPRPTRDTIKSREIPFMCPYRFVKIFFAIA